MYKEIGYIVLIFLLYVLAKKFNNWPIFKFAKKNRGGLILTFSIIGLLYTLIAYKFKFNHIMPSFISILVVIMLIGLFYIFKDHSAQK